MNIDWDKPIQTRGGFDVTIYTRKGKHATLCVVGEIHCESAILTQWCQDGTHERDGQPSPSDIINVPQQHTIWVNVAKRDDGSFTGFIHDSCDEADEMGTNILHRIACFEHTFTEGEGLK